MLIVIAAFLLVLFLYPQRFSSSGNTPESRKRFDIYQFYFHKLIVFGRA